MPSWNQWYNPFDNIANVAKGFTGTLSGGATGSQYNTMSNPDTVYNGAAYYDTSKGNFQEYNDGNYTPTMLGDANQTPTTSSFSTGSGGGGGSTAPAYDPYELQLLDQTIGNVNTELGRFDQYEQGGLKNLLDSYTRGMGQIGSDRNAAQSKYETTKTQNTQDYTDNRAGVRRDAGNLFNSIQRILGQMGAGSSSFAREVAPFAVAQSAAQRFNPLQTQFGRNMGALDTSWNETDRQLTDAERQLEEDRKNKENELRSGLNTNRASLIERLNQLQLQRGQLTGGGLGSLMPQIQENQSRVNSLLDANVGLANRFQNPQLNVARKAFQAPDLEAYNYNRFGAPSLQGGNYDPRADYTRPFAPVTREEEERR